LEENLEKIIEESANALVHAFSDPRILAIAGLAPVPPLLSVPLSAVAIGGRLLSAVALEQKLGAGLVLFGLEVDWAKLQVDLAREAYKLQAEQETQWSDLFSRQQAETEQQIREGASPEKIAQLGERHSQEVAELRESQRASAEALDFYGKQAQEERMDQMKHALDQASLRLG
jgi:hypothetical protein